MKGFLDSNPLDNVELEKFAYEGFGCFWYCRLLRKFQMGQNFFFSIKQDLTYLLLVGRNPQK